MNRDQKGRRALRTAAMLSLGLLLGAGHARAQMPADLESRTALRACADPSHLPYSDEHLDGFENKIAAIVAADLGEPVDYVWYPDTMGFVRNTLLKQRCDVVIGTVSGAEMMDTTNPYYHTGYMLVTREADDITADSIGDPVFATKRIGLIAGTPPATLAEKHDLMANVTPYALTVDTRYDQPSEQMLKDLADGKIDAALVWGPLAGYHITHDHLKLRAVFLSNEGDPMRLDYHIAMGVRPGDVDWRRKLNRIITQEQPRITAILQQYGIPLLDEQNRPIPPVHASTQ